MNPDSRRNPSDLPELLLGYVTGKFWYYIKDSLIQRFILELRKLSLTNGRSKYERLYKINVSDFQKKYGNKQRRKSKLNI